MNRIIESLSILTTSLAETTVERLEDRFKINSAHSYNDSYFQYDVCYYTFVNGEVDLEGNILNGTRRSGADFWNGGEGSEEVILQYGDPEFEDGSGKDVIIKNEELILDMYPGDVLKFDHNGDIYKEPIINNGRGGLRKE